MRWLAVLVLLVGGTALADSESDDGLRPMRVHPRLVGTTVQLTAEYVLDVEGPAFENGWHFVELPPGAVVTSAVARVKGASHRLTLDDAEHVEKVFSSLAEQPAAGGRTWGVRIAKSGSGVDIDLAAGGNGTFVVDLTVEMPGCFFRDARYAQIPAVWYSHLDKSRDRVPHSDELDTTCNNPSAAESSEWLRFPVRELATRPFGDARIGTAAGRLDLGETHLARVEMDLATTLTDVPADLHTAIVIDTSRSMSADAFETQRAIVASYLQHVPPQTSVQVIAYARHAQALLPSWMPAASTAARIDRELRALAPRNGSNVDEALAEAASWLGRTTGTRRVIVIGDGRFSRRVGELPQDSLGVVLPANTLVHVVDVAWAADSFLRSEDVVLAPLAAVTGGIGVGAGLPHDHPIDATMLVRPLSVDRMQITGAGWSNLDSAGTCPIDRGDDGMLAEGASCTWWLRGDALSGPITVEGFLWGRKITRVLRSDPTQGRRLARELTTSDQIVDDDLRPRIDRAAFAVNDAWSMLAMWGGTGGYEDLEQGGSMSGSSSSHDAFSISDAIGTMSSHRSQDLKKQLAPAIEACHAGAAKVSLSVETTLQEIVDVAVAATPHDEALETCITEAVWNLSLTIPDPLLSSVSRVAFEP